MIWRPKAGLVAPREPIAGLNIPRVGFVIHLAVVANDSFEAPW